MYNLIAYRSETKLFYFCMYLYKEWLKWQFQTGMVKCDKEYPVL